MQATQPLTVPSRLHAASCWPWIGRLAFRFVCAYLVLYCWSTLILAILPFNTDVLGTWLETPAHLLSPWVAIHVFHLSGPVTQYHLTGSGDTTLAYVQAACWLAIAILATALWSILDRKRTNYRTLHLWLRLMVRLTLAHALLVYGFIKILALQMPEPSLDTLMKTYGQSSPMRLLWTFVGASQPYQQFSGLVEFLAGALLLFHRTTLLGAFTAAPILVNVLALNLCYDVPVKLYSAHLLFMAVFLIASEVGPLWRFFILQTTSSLRGKQLPKFERQWLRVGAIALNVAVILMIIYNATWRPYESQMKRVAASVARPALYGVWRVDSIAPIRADSPPLATNLNWQTVIIDRGSVLIARPQNGEATSFTVKENQPEHRLTLTGRRTSASGDLEFTRPDEEHLTFTGTVDRVGIQVKLHRLPANQFLLTTRGFHWISEDPFNR